MKKIGIFLIPVLISACQQGEKIKPKETVTRESASIPKEETYSKEISKNSKSEILPTTRTFTEKDRQNEITLQNFFTKIALTPQIFNIDPQRDTIITGEKGTLIYLPAYSFQKKNCGLPCKEKITFSLKECYDYPDMIAENLNTMCHGNMLESKGMIYTEAIAGQDTLELRKGYEIAIAFNEVQENTIFDLYYGERDQQQNINWNLDPLACTSTPIFKLVKGKYRDLDNNFFLKNFRLDKEDMVQLKGKNISYQVSFGNEGEVIGHTFYDNNSETEKTAYKAFIKLLKSYKDYDKNMNFSGWATYFDFMSSDRAEEYYSELEKQMNPLLESKLYYGRSLGWTNCDRNPIFRPIGTLADRIVKKLNKRDEERILKDSKNLIVDLDSPNEKLTIKVLYKNMRSILTPEIIGNKCIFKGIPNGQEVYVLAIKCVEDEIHITKEKITVTDSMPPLHLTYKVYTDIAKAKKEIGELTYL